MQDFTMGFVLCLCLIGLTHEISGARAAGLERSKKIAECEKSLPRSQTCVLIAIPKQETIQEK